MDNGLGFAWFEIDFQAKTTKNVACSFGILRGTLHNVVGVTCNRHGYIVKKGNIPKRYKNIVNKNVI